MLAELCKAHPVQCSALSSGIAVEESLYTFFNEHAQEFGLTHSLDQADRVAIQQKFSQTYATVTANPKESPHMDDFMILDTDTHTGNFVTHQGSICTDFVKLIDPLLDNEMFQAINRLDVVRTDDLKQSLAILGNPMEPEPRLGYH